MLLESLNKLCGAPCKAPQALGVLQGAQRPLVEFGKACGLALALVAAICVDADFLSSDHEQLFGVLQQRLTGLAQLHGGDESGAAELAWS